MKIVILGPAHPLRGGIADFNEALCRSFLEDGQDCRIVSFSYQYPDFLFPGTSQYTSSAPPADLDIQARLHSLNPISWVSTAISIIHSQPDFVIVRYWLPFMAPALGSVCRMLKRKNIRVIAIADNILPHEKRMGDRVLTRYFTKSCDAFVAMSATVLEDLKIFTQKPSSFLPHPVYDIFGEKVSSPIARNHLRLDPNLPLILFFGFIRAYKGLDLLLEAMAVEKLKNSGVKLLLAGEFYEDRDKYDKLIDRLGIRENIIFHTEYIPKEEVKYFFCAANLIVQPYRSATQSGITQIAYHFEKPMLVTRVGGLSEIVKDGLVGYVTPTDPVAIAAAVSDFFENNREEKFVQSVVREKERFTWSAMVKGIKELYEAIR